MGEACCCQHACVWRACVARRCTRHHTPFLPDPHSPPKHTGRLAPQPCFTLAAERFKALQKRGLVEPRKPRGRSTGKRIEYVTGDRRERAEEAQQEIEGMKKARRSAAKAGAAGAGAAAAGVAVAGSGSGKGSKGKRGKAAAVDAAAAAAGSMMPLDVGADGGLW